MNNEQFRRLLVDNPSKASSSTKNGTSTPSRSSGPGATPALGSRARSSIPMTPRNVGSSASELFAKQLREQREGQGPQKKAKYSAAPKGSRLAAGYTDRAQLRNADDELNENSKEARVKALEDMVKLGQMEQADFEKASDQIIGGDIGNVHLVKGLDRKLLARARAGEDVFSTPVIEDKPDPELPEKDVDERLDDLENLEVTPVEREARVKHGNMAPPAAPVAGQKRTRNDILRELREARARAAEEQKAAQPALGAHFKKIGPKNVPGTSRVEVDDQGREVLIVVDASGNVKRKFRKQKKDHEPLPMPAKEAKPLGMDVPENPNAPPVEEESEDIFADAGSDYNPLANLEDDGSDSDSDSEREEGEMKDEPRPPAKDTSDPEHNQQRVNEPAKEDDQPHKPRNYFGTEMEPSKQAIDPLKDPSILNALKRASASRAADANPDQAEELDAEKARQARMQARIAAQDRDAEDMDMGFGSSRFDDQDEGEERKVKLAKWKGLDANGDDDDGDEGGERKDKGGQGQRKRGKKKGKAKGIKNDPSAVLAAMERQKG